MRMTMTAALAACTLGLISGVAGQASAATHFVGGYSVDQHYAGGDGGLGISYADLPGDVDFFLDLGGSATVDLFRIYTNEASINPDDLIDQPISVGFSFTAPTGFGGSVGGVTDGHGLPIVFRGRLLGYTLESGSVAWDGPQILNFGNGGKLKVALNDATFNFGLIDLNGGPNAGAPIRATFTYEAAPVPEPATWAVMIAGFGLSGAALRRRRALSV